MGDRQLAAAGTGTTRWARFWTRLQEVGEAMELSYDELQDRRILALEQEVMQLREALDTAAPDRPGR